MAQSVLDLGSKGCYFETHGSHCVALVQPRKTGNRPHLTEKMLTDVKPHKHYS